MKKIIIIGSAVFVCFIIILVVVNFGPKFKVEIINQNKLPEQVISPQKQPADKVQVFLFHSTQRCSTCIAIGRLAEETVNERFKAELNFGLIEFKEINIDLPENKSLARKFNAGGSSLYINSIVGGEDHIAMDAKVWQLTNDPTAFKDYLENKIKALFEK